MLYRKIAFGLTALASLVLAGCQTVPGTGRSQLQLIGERDEIRMGYAAFRDVLKKEKLSQDKKAIAMVQRVGQRIAAVTGKTGYEWEFKLIDDDKTLNAFCLPGGKVAVYSGLLRVTRDEDGLAAVMGHEIAHAIARHGGERVSQQLLLEGATVALAVSQDDPRRRNLYAGLLGAGATVGVLLPYSRLHEAEADRLGLLYMARAGYDPRAAIGLWQRMSAAGKDRKAPPEILSTHPADRTRVAGLERWMPEALAIYRAR